MKTFINSYLDLLIIARKKLVFAKEHHKNKEVKRIIGVKREIIERLNLLNNEEKRTRKIETNYFNRNNANYSNNNNL